MAQAFKELPAADVEAYATLSDAAEARRSDLWFPRSLILKVEGFA
jgi:hypothetical protein